MIRGRAEELLVVNNKPPLRFHYEKNFRGRIGVADPTLYESLLYAIYAIGSLDTVHNAQPCLC